MEPNGATLTGPLHLLALDLPPDADADAQPEADALRAAGLVATLQVAAADWPHTRLLAEAARADVLLTARAPIDAGLIAAATRAQMILIYGPGNGAARIELEAARRAGIYVTSLPELYSDACAARTWELVLRGFGQCGVPPPARLRLGLVGFGQVGRRVATLAHGAGARLRVYDPFIEDHWLEQTDAQRLPLDELCGWAQALAIQVPLHRATRGLLSARELALLQPGAVLASIGAPEVVDGAALAAGLAQGRPARAIFDAACPLDDAELAARARTAAGTHLVEFARGQRPAHLLIDPPCPRHVLALAGGW